MRGFFVDIPNVLSPGQIFGNFYPKISIDDEHGIPESINGIDDSVIGGKLVASIFTVKLQCKSLFRLLMVNRMLSKKLITSQKVLSYLSVNHFYVQIYDKLIF